MPAYTGWKLYMLLDPETGDVRYVGISNNTARRYREHAKGKGSTKPLRKWVLALKKRGLKPRMEVFHFEGTKEGMLRQEAAVIRQLLRQGCDLLNQQHNTPKTWKRWPKSRKIKGRGFDKRFKRKLTGQTLRR